MADTDENLNGADIPDQPQEEQEDATDLFLKRLMEMDIDGAPPGCAPMRAAPFESSAPPPSESGPPPEKPKPKPKEKKKAPPKKPPEEPPADNVDIGAALESSAWKERKAAYEQMTKCFERKTNFKEYAMHFEKLCGEKNKVAYKDVAKTFLAFFKNAPEGLINEHAKTILSNSMEALGDPAKGIMIMTWTAALEVVEFGEWFAMAQEILKVKNRKVPSVGADIVQTALKEFGGDVCDGQACMEWAIQCCSSSDAGVKKAAQSILVMVSQVFGDADAVYGQAEDGGVKKAILKSLKKSMAKVDGQGLAPTRYRRGEEPGPGDGADAGDSGAAASPKPKPKPKKKPALKLKGVDVFKDLDSGWEASAGESGWKPKKTACDDLFELADAKKAISAGPRWAGVSSVLPTLCGDSNMNVCGAALKVTALLLQRMEAKDTKCMTSALIENCVPKWKEKKSTVKMYNDQVFVALIEKGVATLADVIPALTEAMGDRQAMLRINVCQFLHKIAENKELQPKILDDFDNSSFCAALQKCCTESDGKVREAAGNAMGHIAGFTQISCYMDSVDAIKGKNKSAGKRIDAVMKNYEGQAPVVADEPEPAPKKKAPPKKAKKEEKKEEKKEKPKKAEKKKKGKPKGRARGGKRGGKGRKKESKHMEQDTVASEKDPIVAKDKTVDKYGDSPSMGESECEDVIKALMEGTDSSYDDLESKKWPERDAAYGALLEKVKAGGADSLGVLRFFMYKGIKQTNIKASVAILGIMTAVVQTDQDIETDVALTPLCDTGIFPMLGDKKAFEGAKEYLVACAEAVGPKILIPFALAKMPMDSRSSKIRGSIFEVCVDVVGGYGMSSTNYMFMIMKAHECLNAGPRGEEKDGIVALLTACYQQTGLFFRITLMTSVGNPRMIKLLQESFDPLEDEGVLGKFTPTMKPRGGEFAKPLDMETLVPRKDLSKELAEPAKKLGDKNWKTRKEGIDEIEEVLKGAGGRMKPSVPGPLWTNLRAMMKDTNKNLTVFACRLVATIVEAGGPKFAKQTKEILPAVFPTAGDQKKPVATAAGDAVKAWGMVCGVPTIAKYAHEGLVIEKARPVLIPVIGEILTHYDEKGEEMDLNDMIKPLLDCCMDKNAKIKSATKAFMGIVVKHASGAKVVKVINSEYKSGDAATLMKGLKKVLGDVDLDAGKKKKGKKEDKKKKGKEKKGKGKKKKEEAKEEAPPEEPEDLGPLKVNLKARKGRLGKKRRYKGSWVEHQVGELKQLKKYMNNVCSPELYELCFGERSELKEWEAAHKIFLEQLTENVEAVKNNLDIILCWSCRVMCVKNATNSDMSTMNFWKTIFQFYKENDLTLVNHEADQVLPCLVERHMSSMKKQVSELGAIVFEAGEEVYNPIMCARYCWDCFENTKNGRAKSSALLMLDRLFHDYGLDIVAKKPGKKQLLVSMYKGMDKADNNVRKAMLTIFVTFAHALGKDKILKIISKASAKTKDMISNRLTKTKFDTDFVPAKTDKYCAEKKAGGDAAKATPEKGGKAPKGGKGKAPAGDASSSPAEASAAPVASQAAAPQEAAAPQFQPVQMDFSLEAMKALPNAFQPINWEQFSFQGAAPADPNASAAPAMGSPGQFNMPNFFEGLPSMQFGNSMGMQGMGSMGGFGAMPGMQPGPGSGGLGMGSMGSFGQPPASDSIPDIIAGLEGKRPECLDTLRSGFKANKWSDDVLKPHTERLVASLVGWWQEILGNPESVGQAERQTLSENLIECLFDISQKGPVLATLAMHSLENFIRVMLVSLISPSVRRSFSNRKALIARLNDITLEVLQKCDRTMAFYILISFLKQAEPEEVDSPIESTFNFSNVVVKCLAKLMILIPKVIKEMKVDQILQVIHQFFTLKPPQVWNRPGCNNKPYRVARTCLSKFVEFKGPEILQDLRKVVGDNPDPKPVIQMFTEEFIQKKFPNYQPPPTRGSRGNSFSSLFDRTSSGYRDTSNLGGFSGGSPSAGGSQDELIKIMNSMDPANSGYDDPALKSLYDYMQRHPNSDLEVCLAGQSEVKKDFVRRGLKHVEEQERRASMTQRRMNRTPSTSSVTSNTTATSRMSTDDLRERLNALRQKSAQNNRRRDNSISIDNIRDRLAKFQTSTVRDSVTSTTLQEQGPRMGSGSSIGLGSTIGLNSSLNSSNVLPTGTSSNSVLNDTTERRQSTTLADLRQRLNRIKAQGT